MIRLRHFLHNVKKFSVRVFYVLRTVLAFMQKAFDIVHNIIICYRRGTGAIKDGPSIRANGSLLVAMRRNIAGERPPRTLGNVSEVATRSKTKRMQVPPLPPKAGKGSGVRFPGRRGYGEYA
jgi:hypothetical protein